MTLLIRPWARDQALYEWEWRDLLHRPGVGRIDLGGLRRMANEIWAAEKWYKLRACPQVAVLKGKPREASCIGCSLLLFGVRRMDPVTLCHELTHARRLGTQTNMHTRGFVEQYILLLSKYLGWHIAELEFQALSRGLI